MKELYCKECGTKLIAIKETLDPEREEKYSKNNPYKNDICYCNGKYSTHFLL